MYSGAAKIRSVRGAAAPSWPVTVPQDPTQPPPKKNKRRIIPQYFSLLRLAVLEKKSKNNQTHTHTQPHLHPIALEYIDKK